MLLYIAKSWTVILFFGKIRGLKYINLFNSNNRFGISTVVNNCKTY